VDKSN